MANPQMSNGYTQLAHEVLEALYAHEFTAKELRVVLFLIRKTYGWNKKVDTFSVRDVKLALGIPYERVRETIVHLIQRHVIRLVKAAEFNSPASYMFEKNWEVWSVRKTGHIGPKKANTPRNEPLPQKDEDFSPEFRGEVTHGSEGDPHAENPDNHAPLEEPKPREIQGDKSSYPKSFSPKKRGANPPNPPEVLETEETGEEHAELQTVVLETLRGRFGSVTRPNETKVRAKVRALASEFGYPPLAAGAREALREAIFTSENPAPGKKAWSPIATFLAQLAKHVAAAAGLAQANRRTAARRAAENLAPRTPKRYEYVPPQGWKVPDLLLGDFNLLDTPLARFIQARQAGLPEGGAGPGPELGSLRDSNDLEEPHGT